MCIRIDARQICEWHSSILQHFIYSVFSFWWLPNPFWTAREVVIFCFCAIISECPSLSIYNSKLLTQLLLRIQGETARNQNMLSALFQALWSKTRAAWIVKGETPLRLCFEGILAYIPGPSGLGDNLDIDMSSPKQGGVTRVQQSALHCRKYWYICKEGDELGFPSGCSQYGNSYLHCCHSAILQTPRRHLRFYFCTA